jgi:hypothetical protein
MLRIAPILTRRYARRHFNSNYLLHIAEMDRVNHSLRLITSNQLIFCWWKTIPAMCV